MDSISRFRDNVLLVRRTQTARLLRVFWLNRSSDAREKIEKKKKGFSSVLFIELNFGVFPSIRSKMYFSSSALCDNFVRFQNIELRSSHDDF